MLSFHKEKIYVFLILFYFSINPVNLVLLSSSFRLFFPFHCFIQSSVISITFSSFFIASSCASPLYSSTPYNSTTSLSSSTDSFVKFHLIPNDKLNVIPPKKIIYSAPSLISSNVLPTSASSTATTSSSSASTSSSSASTSSSSASTSSSKSHFSSKGIEENNFNIFELRVLITALFIFFGGVLASTAGIGGGAIFVTILMFVGRYSLKHSIPLSKSMIMCGSLVSFLINITIKHPHNAKTVIDFDIVKMIGPMAMGGTLIGVFCNGIVPELFLIFCLFLILMFLTYKTFTLGFRAYKKENEDRLENAFNEISLVDYAINIKNNEFQNNSNVVLSDNSSGKSQKDAGKEGKEEKFDEEYWRKKSENEEREQRDVKAIGELNSCVVKNAVCVQRNKNENKCNIKVLEMAKFYKNVENFENKILDDKKLNGKEQNNDIYNFVHPYMTENCERIINSSSSNNVSFSLPCIESFNVRKVTNSSSTHAESCSASEKFDLTNNLGFPELEKVEVKSSCTSMHPASVCLSSFNACNNNKSNNNEYCNTNAHISSYISPPVHFFPPSSTLSPRTIGIAQDSYLTRTVSCIELVRDITLLLLLLCATIVCGVLLDRYIKRKEIIETVFTIFIYCLVSFLIQSIFIIQVLSTNSYYDRYTCTELLFLVFAGIAEALYTFAIKQQFSHHNSSHSFWPPNLISSDRTFSETSSLPLASNENSLDASSLSFPSVSPPFYSYSNPITSTSSIINNTNRSENNTTHVPNKQSTSITLRSNNSYFYSTSPTSLFSPKWTAPKCSLYFILSTIGGICSGLLGIGGGLIFSPLLVFLKIDALICVSTAATCVIFTSTSTTFQYFMIDRILFPDAFFFAFCTSLASLVGVKTLHFISTKFWRKSFIIFAVATAVGLSSILTITKAALSINQ